MRLALRCLRRQLPWFAIWLAVFACPLGADDSLAAALLAAPDSAARSQLLQGHPQTDITQALADLEKTGAARVTARDSPGALAAFQAALDVAQISGMDARVAYYMRQIGLRQSALGRADLALAAYQQGVAAAEKRQDTGILAENLHGAALAMHRLSRFAESVPYSEREVALVQNGTPFERLRALVTYAAGLGDLGRVKESAAIYERCMEVARTTGNPQDELVPMTNLALLYASLGQSDAALRIMHDVVKRRDPPEPLDWVNIGVMEHDAGRLDLADEAHRKAISQSGDARHWQELSAATLDLAISARDRGRLSEAREHAEASLKVAVEHQSIQYQTVAWTELANIAIAERNLPVALDAAAKSVALGRASRALVQMEEALIVNGNALEKSGRGDEAARTYAEAIDVVEAMRVETPSFAPGLAASLEHWMPAYRGAVRNALKSGKVNEALQLAERAKARLLLDMLEGGAQGLDAYLTADERAEMKRLNGEVTRARHAYLSATSNVSRQPLADAERAAGFYEQRLFSRHPELVLQTATLPELRPEQVSSLVPDRRTALLDYFFLGEKQLALFVVRAGARRDEPSVHAMVIPFDPARDAQAASFRQRIAARDLDYAPLGRSLYAALIGPAAAHLAGADRWIVSPSASLWDLPFQALIDGTGKHLLETRSIAFAPSLSSLWMLRERGRQSRPASLALLGLANPALQGAQPLPEAESELRGIAELYGPGRGVALFGSAAGINAFRDKAPSAAIIHLAAHAEMDARHPLESFLALTPAKGDDGALTARQILAMRLHANLVVLSACETGRGEIVQGEGILGLGWAFEAAGASSVVLSQWKVDSGATRDLMIEFHKRLLASRGEGKAEALRQAALATMRMPGRKHPFYWAAFIQAGDGR